MAIKSSLTSVRDIFESPESYSQKSIQVGGWVKGLRSSNAFGFIELNDGSAFKNLQVVIEADKLAKAMQICDADGKVVVTGNRDGATCREYADYLMETVQRV